MGFDDESRACTVLALHSAFRSKERSGQHRFRAAGADRSRRHEAAEASASLGPAPPSTTNSISPDKAAACAGRPDDPRKKTGRILKHFGIAMRNFTRSRKCRDAQELVRIRRRRGKGLATICVSGTTSAGSGPHIPIIDSLSLRPRGCAHEAHQDRHRMLILRSGTRAVRQAANRRETSQPGQHSARGARAVHSASFFDSVGCLRRSAARSWTRIDHHDAA